MINDIIKTTIAAAAIVMGSAMAWAGSNAAAEAGKAYAAQDYNKALELYGQAAKTDGVSGSSTTILPTPTTASKTAAKPYSTTSGR